MRDEEKDLLKFLEDLEKDIAESRKREKELVRGIWQFGFMCGMILTMIVSLITFACLKF